MDPIEKMVNQHHDDVRDAARNRHQRKHGKRIIIAAAVAAACLLFMFIGLVQPVLALPLTVSSLMYACYHIGRCAGFRKRVD